MKTKVIDIRQHPIEKVIAYLVSQGGEDTSRPDDIENFPYCGIDTDKRINYWTFIAGDRELIDLPESQDDSEEEFKTGDRVVDEHDDLGTVIGTLDGVTYYKEDDGAVYDTDQFQIKHYKEPELFEGWMHSLDKCHVYKTNVDASMVSSLGRVFKVREIVEDIKVVEDPEPEDKVKLCDTKAFTVKDEKDDKLSLLKAELLCHFQHFLGTYRNTLSTSSDGMTYKARKFLKENPDAFKDFI
jgi:hypothetical protein